jgi:hypothetical protein
LNTEYLLADPSDLNQLRLEMLDVLATAKPIG